MMQDLFYCRFLLYKTGYEQKTQHEIQLICQDLAPHTLYLQSVCCISMTCSQCLLFAQFGQRGKNENNIYDKLILLQGFSQNRTTREGLMGPLKA